MKKRILSILLLCCMVLTMLPTTVLAADGPMDTIPKYDVSIDVYNRTSDISIKDSRSYYIYSSVPDKLRDTWAWDKKIFIKGDKTAPHVFIDGVNIEMSPSSKGPAIELNKKASAYIYFIGKNSSLQGADGRAAIQKNRSEGQLYVLARTGTTVTCKGGDKAAGIGGSYATRNISNGYYNGDMYGHGVNMHFGSQSNPDYWDGTIAAIGGQGGAGIGGGGSYGTDGAEVEPDICALNPSGKIEYYAPGSGMTGTPNKTVTNPTGDYIWDGGRVTKPATCTEKGVRTYTCTGSTHTRTEDIPALNHSFAGQAYVSDNNATCEQDGTKTVKCVRYGRGGCTEKDTVVDTGSMLGHSFDEEAYVSDNNATCEQDGTKTAKCVRYGTGGCTATDTVTDTDSKLGHLFEDYISNNDATYARDGTKTAKCVRYDQCGETHTIPDEGSRLKLPLYRVTDRDGRDIAYTAGQTGGVLTVTVDEDFAILTGKLSGLRTLKSQGVEKIVFVTRGAASAFRLSDMLSKGESGEAYRLTHDTKAVTFTLGESTADVSAILTKP